jgi:hypothetical protein
LIFVERSRRLHIFRVARLVANQQEITVAISVHVCPCHIAPRHAVEVDVEGLKLSPSRMRKAQDSKYHEHECALNEPER